MKKELGISCLNMRPSMKRLEIMKDTSQKNKTPDEPQQTDTCTNCHVTKCQHCGSTLLGESIDKDGRYYLECLHCGVEMPMHE